MKLCYTIAILVFVAACSVVNAQSPSWQWGRGAAAGGAGANAIATDAAGNSYITGYTYSDTVTIGDVTFSNDSGATGFFIAKYDSAGNVLWANEAAISSVNGYYVSGNAICFDPSGNIYVTGYYQGDTIAFGNYTFNGAGLFMVKYDTAGNVLLATNGGNTAGAHADAIGVDLSGNIFVAGLFGPDPVVIANDTLVDNTTHLNMFVTKFDAAGNPLWARSTNANIAKGLATDAGGNCYLTGNFTDATVVFGNDTLTNPVAATVYTAKFDSAGNIIWARAAKGSLPDNTTDQALAISSDAAANVYITGFFTNSSIIFGNDTIMNPGNSECLFLVKYNSSGNVIWAKATGGAGYSNTTGCGVIADAIGNTYLTGWYSAEVIFGQDTLSTYQSDDLEAFVAKYDTAGNAVWGISPYYYRFSGAGGNSLSMDAAGNIYTVGTFESPFLQFGTDTVIDWALYYSITMDFDFFIAKVKNHDPQCTAVVPAITAGKSVFCTGDSTQICASSGYESYQWNAGPNGTSDCIEVKNAGDYYVMVVDSNGCRARSAALTISVAPLPVDSITADKTIFCANDSMQICSSPGFISYQWSTGVTGSSNCIETNIAGDYYVLVTDSAGCTAQSNRLSISVYPTPVVSISEQGDTLAVFNAVTVQWYLDSSAITGATDSIYIAHRPGSYTVQITDSNGCTAVSNPVVITGITNLIESNISLYPNPANNKWQLTVDNSLLRSKLTVFDDNGKTVYESGISKLKTEINFNAANGVYLLRISSGDVSVVRKLVKM